MAKKSEIEESKRFIHMLYIHGNISEEKYIEWMDKASEGDLEHFV